MVARSTDDGASWTAAVTLNTNVATESRSHSNPQVTTDGAGNWVAVWWSEDDLGGTFGRDEDILVARSTDNGASWTVPAALNTNAATDLEDDSSPQVTTDGAGNWVTVWDSRDALCVHRTGALEIGDLAVWIGVSAPHRQAAFDACRHIIDQIKLRVPIWKKEH